MGRRALAWGLALPLAGAGVLVGHDLAYRLTGAVPDDLHGYLAHGPQLVAILATVGLLGLALDLGGPDPGPRRFAFLAAIAFVAQEHLERLMHTGSVPFVVGDRTFLLGLALQLPVGLACAAIARMLRRTLRATRPSLPPRGSILTIPLDPPAPTQLVVPALARPSRGRAPPLSTRF